MTVDAARTGDVKRVCWLDDWELVQRLVCWDEVE